MISARQQARTVEPGAIGLEAELVAEVDFANDLVGGDVLGRAFHEDGALMENVGAVNDAEGLAHVVIGDENADAACP